MYQKDKLRQLFHKLIPGIFFSILILGMVSSILQKDVSFSNTENRYLASLPKFSISSLFQGTYTTSLENYLNDHFIGRDQWITVKTLAEKIFFHKYAIQDVIFGNDSYLMNRYTEKDVDPVQIQKNVQYLNAFQKDYDADVILVPAASEILTTRLSGPIDQLNYKELLKDAKVTVPADEILSAHKEDSIYYKTDHHWTLEGAYDVYKSYVKDPVAYSPERVSENFQGTIARKIGITSITDSMKRQKSDSTFHVTYDEAVDCNSLYEPFHLTTMDQYSYYLDGNHSVTQIQNLSRMKAHRSAEDSCQSILIIKDSFANTFATLLCENYDTVHMIDLRYYNGSIQDYVQTHDIQNVLFLYSKISFMQDKNLSKLLR